MPGLETPHDLIQLLRDPASGQAFSGSTVGDGELRLPDGRVFPVVDSVPVLLDSQEKTVGQADPMEEDIKNYFRDMWEERDKQGVKFWQDDGYTYGLCRDAALASAGSLHHRSVLLLGAGRGHETRIFQEAGARTLTTDILLDGLFNPAITGERAVMDAHKLYLADSSLDVVYAQSMLMFTQPDQVIAEVLRVLKPGGLFISVEPLAGGMLFKLLFSLLNRFKDYDALSVQPPNYMTRERFTALEQRFSRTVFKRLMVASPLYHPFRIARMQPLVDAYFGLERAVLHLIPALGGQCMFTAHVLQK